MGPLCDALAKASPREPRYARLLIALLAWFIYYNLLAIGRARISQGVWDPRLGFWWVEIPTALIALYLLWDSQRLPGPRKRPAAKRVPATAKPQ
jgi:lipopolysaccharide export system permease protein